MKTIAAVIIAWIVALATPAFADDAADRAAMRDIISGQIAAFQADDGARAYSFASPMIQSVYPTPEGFMAMVRGGYQPVYRPRSFTFGEAADTSSGPTQKVYLTGPDGASYVALYTFQRQPDGSWKINGCTILKDESPSI